MSSSSSSSSHEPTRVSTLKRESRERRERMEKERLELEEKRVKEDEYQKQENPRTLVERVSYVEEPPSNVTTLERRERKAEKALVRRITNEMHMATYVHQVEIPKKHPVGAYTPGIYRIRALRFFETGLQHFFWSFGKLIANRPFFSLITAILFFCAVVSVPVYNRESIRFESPFQFLNSDESVISNGLAVTSRWNRFNSSNPAFSCLKWRQSGQHSVIMKETASKETILRKEAVLAYNALKKKLDHFPVEKRELMVQCSLDCETDKDMVDRIIKKSPQVALTYPETFVSLHKDSANLSRIYLGANIGGVDLDTDGAISRAESLLMDFELKEDLKKEEKDAWFKHFDEQVRLTSAPNVSIFSWSPAAFESAILETIKEQYFFLSVCGAMLFIFCFFSSFGPNSYQSKPMVGIAIFAALFVAVAAGFSVQFYKARPVDPLTWPTCFIVIGIGTIWLLGLHSCWSRFSSAAVHPTEKIAFILAHEATGVTLSAILLVLTFGLMAIFTTIDHLFFSLLSLIAAIALLLIFCALFVSIFVFFGGRREASGVKWYQFWKKGDLQFTAPQVLSFDSSSFYGLHDRLVDSRPCLARALGAKLTARSARYPIVFFCTAYIIFAVWGFAGARIDMREEFFLPADSNPAKFIQLYREQFGKTTNFLELTVENSVDYHDEHVQKALISILDGAVNDGHATRSISWLTEFLKFEKSSIYDINPDTFVPVLNLVFLTSESYRRFASDVVLDRFQTQIVKSRMYLELTDKGYDNRVEMVRKMLSKATEAGLPIAVDIPKTMSLKHDIDLISNYMYLTTITLVGVLILSFISLGQPALTFLLVINSCAVVIETIGYSAIWGVPLNEINLAMAVSGSALAFTMIMAFCYNYSLSGKAQIRAGVRVQYTFQATLLPVTCGCLIPVITYLPLLSVNAPVIIHVGKILAINSLAILIHYFLFLPNLMILFSENPGLSLTSLNCSDCCCEVEEEESIYYIPTVGRAVQQEGAYSRYGCYGVHPKQISPPQYLAIAPPPAVYGDYGHVGRPSRRVRSNSESSLGPIPTTTATITATPQQRRPRRERRAVSTEDGQIYEAPPSPRVIPTSVQNSPRPRAQQPRGFYPPPPPQWMPQYDMYRSPYGHR